MRINVRTAFSDITVFSRKRLEIACRIAYNKNTFFISSGNKRPEDMCDISEEISEGGFFRKQ